MTTFTLHDAVAREHDQRAERRRLELALRRQSPPQRRVPARTPRRTRSGR